MPLEFPTTPELMLSTVAQNMVANLGPDLAIDLSVRAIGKMLDHVNADGLDMWLDLHARMQLAYVEAPRKVGLLH